MEQMVSFRDQRPHLRKQPEPEARIADGLLGVIMEPEDQGIAASYY